jgi:hypothetical protein
MCANGQLDCADTAESGSAVIEVEFENIWTPALAAARMFDADSDISAIQTLESEVNIGTGLLQCSFTMKFEEGHDACPTSFDTDPIDLTGYGLTGTHPGNIAEGDIYGNCYNLYQCSCIESHQIRNRVAHGFEGAADVTTLPFRYNPELCYLVSSMVTITVEDALGTVDNIVYEWVPDTQIFGPERLDGAGVDIGFDASNVPDAMDDTKQYFDNYYPLVNAWDNNYGITYGQ